MPKGSELRADDTARRSGESAGKKAARGSLAAALRVAGGRLCRTLFAAKWACLLGLLFLVAGKISVGFADATAERMILPI